jgi:hypothetical protein
MTPAVSGSLFRRTIVGCVRVLVAWIIGFSVAYLFLFWTLGGADQAAFFVGIALIPMLMAYHMGCVKFVESQVSLTPPMTSQQLDRLRWISGALLGVSVVGALGTVLLSDSWTQTLAWVGLGCGAPLAVSLVLRSVARGHRPEVRSESATDDLG